MYLGRRTKSSKVLFMSRQQRNSQMTKEELYHDLRTYYMRRMDVDVVCVCVMDDHKRKCKKGLRVKGVRRLVSVQCNEWLFVTMLQYFDLNYFQD